MRLWSEVVDLITVTKTDDGGGGFVETEKTRQVYANKKSIRQSEFYQAHMAGLQPEIVFEVHEFEYEGEALLRYDGVRYRIIRTYSTGDIVELVCQREVGTNGQV